MTAATEPVNADEVARDRPPADGGRVVPGRGRGPDARPTGAGRDPAVEAMLVDARHRAFAELPQERSDAPWPTPVPDVFAGVAGIPEITAAELTVERLGAGLQHHGSLLVRGLLDPQVCAAVTDEIARAFRDADARAGTRRHRAPRPRTSRSSRREGYDFGVIERQFFRFGAVLAVEAPHALFMVIEELRRSRRHGGHRRVLRRVARPLGEEDLAAAGRAGRADRVAPGRRVPRRRHPDGERVDARSPRAASTRRRSTSSRGRSPTSWPPGPTTPATTGRSAPRRRSGRDARRRAARVRRRRRAPVRPAHPAPHRVVTGDDPRPVHASSRGSSRRRPTRTSRCRSRSERRVGGGTRWLSPASGGTRSSRRRDRRVGSRRVQLGRTPLDRDPELVEGHAGDRVGHRAPRDRELDREARERLGRSRRGPGRTAPVDARSSSISSSWFGADGSANAPRTASRKTWSAFQSSMTKSPPGAAAGTGTRTMRGSGPYLWLQSSNTRSMGSPSRLPSTAAASCAASDWSMP